MPDVFDHGSNLKLVSATGFAPAVTRSQAEHVAATLRAVRPGGFGKAPGTWFRVETESHVPWNVFPLEIGGPEGSCTLNPPADNGALCSLSYESEKLACHP